MAAPEDVSYASKAAKHIRELNAIHEQIPRLLQAAGQAINSLTNAPLPSHLESTTANSLTSPADALSAHKEAFTAHTKTYFMIVKQLSSALSSQVEALEAAGIIPHDVPVGADPRGGMGNMDIGWLNSRADRVGRGKLAELLAEVRTTLEKENEESAMEVDLEDEMDLVGDGDGQ